MCGLVVIFQIASQMCVLQGPLQARNDFANVSVREEFSDVSASGVQVGKFPNVFEQLAANHLERKDEVCLLEPAAHFWQSGE